MHQIPEYSDLLKLIDERSAVFRATIESAPDLDAQVPGCPDWKLLDLATHLGAVQRRWAGIIATGPADGPPEQTAKELAADGPSERAALVAWLAEGTRQLLAAGREAGPDRGCWTWWGDSESPETSGAVIRHQVQEVTVHTFDAQSAAGTPQPLPAEAAVDGVEEFCVTSGTTKTPWPYPEVATIDFIATEGASWRATMSPAGASVSRLPDSGEGVEAATAWLRGAASDIVLTFYSRTPLGPTERGGEVDVIEQLFNWDF